MSLHRSLKTTPGALNQHRNVLTRAERITKLTDEDRFDLEEASPLGLVKVASRKVVTAKKKKAAEGEGEGEGEGEATTEGEAAAEGDGAKAPS